MSNPSTALWDKLVTPVIIMVLGFLATWVFSINSDMAVMKQSVNRVDAVVVEQRNMERMLIVLEAQNKNYADLANQIKNSQDKVNDAVVELRIAITKISTMLPDKPEREFSRTPR